MRWTFFVTVWLCLPATGASPWESTMRQGPVKPQSMGTLSFGPEGVLFIGDSVAGTVYAIDTGDRTEGRVEGRRNILDLEGQIAAYLGVPASEVLIHDMAVNPISQNTYLTISRGRGAWSNPFELPNDLASADTLLKLDVAGTLSRVDLADVRHASRDLPNPIAADKKHAWKTETRARVDAISDMVFQDGKLYVAGLSNEEFASTLRIMPFPFEDMRSASVEVFHGAHGKYETASPIRAMLPTRMNDREYLVAAYLCTPLAVFDHEALEAGGKVRGKTIGELGSGNYPTDMVRFTKDGKDYILMSNTNRTLMVFDTDEIAAHAQGEGITRRVSHRAGIGYTDISGAGVQQLDMLGEETVQIMQRMPSGKLALYGMPIRRLVR